MFLFYMLDFILLQKCIVSFPDYAARLLEIVEKKKDSEKFLKSFKNI